MLRVVLLLLPGFWECRNTRNNRDSHENDGNNSPNDAPASRRATVTLREDTCVGRVDLAKDEIVADIPNAVERRHDADEQHHEAKGLRMRNEPAGNEQCDGQDDREYRQPVFAAPPQGEQEADCKNDASNLARHNIEAAKYEQGADERRTQVACGECDGADPSGHQGRTAFARVEGNGFDMAASATSSGGMPEFMESNHKHLSRGGQLDCMALALRSVNVP